MTKDMEKNNCLDLAQMKLAKCSSLEKERAQMKGYTKKNKWKRDKISWSVINLIQSILGIKNNIFKLHLFCPIHPPKHSDIYTTLKAKIFLQLEFLVPISDVFYLELFGVAILMSTQAVVGLYSYYL